MKTIQLNFYSFAELSAGSKEKALNNLWDANVFYDWWDAIYEDAKTAGLKILGFDIYREYHCKAEFLEDAINCAALVVENHGEETGTYRAAQLFRQERDAIVLSWPKYKFGDFEDCEVLDKELDNIEANYLKAISYEYLRLLTRTYEYLTSEASIIETIESNDYFFTADGNLATTLEKLATM